MFYYFVYLESYYRSCNVHLNCGACNVRLNCRVCNVRLNCGACNVRLNCGACNVRLNYRACNVRLLFLIKHVILCKKINGGNKDEAFNIGGKNYFRQNFIFTFYIYSFHCRRL